MHASPRTRIHWMALTLALSLCASGLAWADSEGGGGHGDGGGSGGGSSGGSSGGGGGGGGNWSGWSSPGGTRFSSGGLNWAQIRQQQGLPSPDAVVTFSRFGYGRSQAHPDRQDAEASQRGVAAH